MDHHVLLIILLLILSSLSPSTCSPSDHLTPDFTALRRVLLDLGVNGARRLHDENLCLSPGISCERRVTRGSSAMRVTRIVLDSQRLNGFLSPAVGWMPELRELSLSGNELFSGIPAQIGGCRKLEVLNLRRNGLSGEVPPEFSSLVNLRHLDLSSNELSGDLSFLRNARRIETVSLSDNLFAGKVPAFLSSFQNLKFLNLSATNLDEPEIKIGSLIQRAKNLNSQKLKIKSFSHRAQILRDSEIKVEAFSHRYRLEENSYKTKSSNGNQTSAQAQAPASAKNKNSTTAPAPSPSQSHKKHKKRNTKSWILGFFIGAAAGVLTGAVFSTVFRLLLNCMHSRGGKPGPDIFSPIIKKSEDLAFLEKEDGLSSLEIVGRGGCGEVYKAELPNSNGKLIAIKKIIQPSLEGADLTEEDSRLLTRRMRQIRSEIQTVGHIRHRNLLPLLAHVSRPDCHFLVYEYMKNGSLQDVLRQVSEGTRELDWPSRHKIAMGIASGLEYLHQSHNPRIIHRDLKPANVLLNDDMEARIADFGLAKPMPEANTHVTTSNVAGTVGFIAPEYHQTLKFTDKCDIYSFGVVLVTLVMGKLPSDDFFQTTEELSLVKWLRSALASENPTKAVDPKLLGLGYDDEMVLVLKIACFCTLDDPTQRPNSKEARCMLSQVKTS